MKKTSILTLGLLIAILTIATSTYAQRNCGTDAAWAQVLADNPKYATSRIALEQSIQQYIQANPNKGASSTAKKVIYTIPTVVHVVYNTGAQNISDAQVISQITVLNEDFRRTNADAAITPSAFLGVAADCEIEFCLAQQDPNGIATNGITRTSTSTTSFSGNGAVKSDGSGGKSPWPRADYLNIWVCNLGGGILGYAIFPGGPAASDGVVIGYNYFGTTSNVPAPFNKGRTTTHEVGHWLALYHTFNGGCSGTTSSNCGTSGDRCCDTPPTSSENYFCPGTQNTCTETPTDQNDMTMNFMDYVNDNCMNLFTLDQKARLVAVMTGSRASLQSSVGCVNPTALALDAGISLIASPTGTSCATSVTPVVTIENFGASTLTTANILSNVDGGANSTYTWTGSLSTGQTQAVTLPSITVAAGSHTFNSWSTSPNGGTDLDGSNDASASSFTIAGSSGASLPFTEGFENTTFPPSGWVLDNPNANATFTRVTSANGFGNSSACAKMDFYASPSSAGQSDFLYTVDLDLSSASSPTVMDFNLAYTRYGAANQDSLIILVSTDCGSTWTREWQDGGTSMATAADNTSAFTPSSAQWSAETVNLNAYNGFGAVQIQFHAYSGWGNNLYLDDINIYTGGGGPAPVADFIASSTSICESTTLSFTDLSTNSPTSWLWTFVGGSPSSSTVQNPSVSYGSAGSYAVTLLATNGNGSDTKTTTSYITVNPSPTGSISSTSASCGGCDAMATVAGTGGSIPYSYSWSTVPVQNVATATSLCAGFYSVTISDANGCSGSANVTVSSAGGLTSNVSSSDASCGSCDGSGMVSGSGGTIPYSYLWSNGNTSSSALNLCAGVYTVTVTDNSGCSNSNTITIGSSGSLSVSATGSTTSCSGSCDGIASSSVVSGSLPYTYAWSTSPVQNSSGATGLCAGSYTVTITDANGCSGSANVTVGSAGGLTSNVSSSDASCGSCDGSGMVSGSGGTIPYSYLWSNGNTSSSALNLCAGVYTVTVTDNSGCSNSNTITIGSIGSLSVSATGSTTSCSGSCNGIASTSVLSGTSPYTYAWSTFPVQNSNSATGLCPGSYTVTIIDSAGCIATTTATVIDGPSISVSATSTDATCNGVCDGSAAAIVTGGTGALSYSWNTTPSQITASANGLCAGTYTVNATDAIGCTSSGSVTITEPTAMILSLTSSDADCGKSDGSATASASNGNSPYNYLWSDGQNSAVASALSAGAYSVTVVDNNGCSQTSSVTVNNPGAPTISVSSSNLLCNGDNDGSASVFATGGFSPYTYTWSNGGSSTDTISGLTGGTYTVAVADTAGCIVTEFFTITEPPAVVVSLSFSQVSNDSTCDGLATAVASGGTGSLTYLWSDSSGQTTPIASGLCLGIVSVMVTDGNGCATSASIYVDSVIISVQTIPTETLEMVVFPNPTSGTVNVRFGNTKGKELKINIFDISGRLIINDKLEIKSQDIYTLDLSKWESGIYFIRVIEANDFVITRKISLIK